jgi:hypothetical protein
MTINVAGGSILGEMVGARQHRSRTYSARRECRIAGCATVLSIYNSKQWCGMHSI